MSDSILGIPIVLFLLEPIEIFLLVIVSIVVYFIPTVVAIYRNVKNLVPIALLNLLLGFTYVFWVGALIWAIMDKQKVKNIETPIYMSRGQE